MEKIKYCIHCNKQSKNYPYCYECYNKYYRISSSSYELINNISKKEKSINSINTVYKLNNKTHLKSKSELLIANFFEKNRIPFEYEKPFYYKEGQKPLYPDFYIEGPRYYKGRWLKNIYIEHFGGAKSNSKEEQIKYLETVKFKIPIYKEKNVTLICTYEDDINDLEIILSNKLKNHIENTINYLKES